MSLPMLMVAYTVEMKNGSSKSGTVAVPGTDPNLACRAVVGLVRGSTGAKYARPKCFADIMPHEVDDVTATCIGNA